MRSMQKNPWLGMLAVAQLVFMAGGSQADTIAYWRFEEGEPGRKAKVVQAAGPDTSGQGNNLAVANTEVQPPYTADVPFGSIPQTGKPNAVAAQLRGRNDFYTREQKINSVDLSRTGSNAWTVEFSFRLRSAEGVSRLVGRDGNSQGGERRGPLQILAVGGEDNQFDVRVEMLDGTGKFQDVASRPIYRVGHWYNVAATATDNTLNLYIDQLDGQGYQLVGIKPIQGAANATRGGFSVGRGWNGGAADWMEGNIDEVRISNEAMPPARFLFTTPAGQGVVAPAPLPDAGIKTLNIPLFWGADPHVSFFEGQYWMYITGKEFGRGNPSFFAYSSPDLKTWKEHGPVLQFKDVAWIGPHNRGPWAPGVTSKNGKYYFYYSVGPQTATHPARVGVGVGDSPAGPFKDKGEALLTGGNGFEAIDAMVFNDPVSGKSYFYVGGSAGAKLRVFELNLDMMSFAREIPSQTPPQFTEGAFMHLHNGTYYLSYSHGYWRGSSYSVHYATSTTPYGPWEYRSPILVSDDERMGPGHHSFVQDAKTGQWLIVYHRWQNPSGGHPLRARSRSIAIEPISYGPTGEILPITMTDNFLPRLQATTPSPLTRSWHPPTSESFPSLHLTRLWQMPG